MGIKFNVVLVSLYALISYVAAAFCFRRYLYFTSPMANAFIAIFMLPAWRWAWSGWLASAVMATIYLASIW